MSEVLEKVVKENTYLGLTKIALLPIWELESGNYAITNPMTYVAYAKMRRWLMDTKTMHRFEWVNSGDYLPNYLWIDVDSDSATYFKLKYGV